jgi:NADPH2:quinone reductase
LGLEIAGTVEHSHPSVSGFKVGQAVCALVAGGGYSEYVAVPADMLMRVPLGLSMVQAAALPETCMTVWANVFERCALAPGEVFLVHAGASSIGLTAIAMAKALGARVLTTVSGADKAAICREQGADAVFYYRGNDWAADAASYLSSNGLGGVDVILDMVAGDTVAANLNLLSTEGRLAIIAQLGGAIGQVDTLRVMLKRLTLTGSTLRARTPEYKRHLSAVLQDRLWPVIERGQFRPVIHQVLPVEQVVQAHEILESRTNSGKVILTF